MNKFANDTKNSLTNANDYINDALYYAKNINDKVLSDKMIKIKDSIKETVEYLDSRSEKKV